VLFVRPDDPAARGPWAVGVRTVEIAGLTTEVWYPARWESQDGKPKVRYDLRQQLPTAEQGKIPDDHAPWQSCECYRDLPIDELRGPFPVVLFLHGLASFRTQSATQTTHWASRGFVVLAADHPGLRLADILTGRLSGDQVADAGKILDAVADPQGSLSFLRGRLAQTRLAVAGFSAGGRTAGGMGSRPGVQVLIVMASRGVEAGSSLVSALIMGGNQDATAPYPRQQSGYESSPRRKRLVGLSQAGHLAFTDLCAAGREHGGLFRIAVAYGVTGASGFEALASDGCKPEQLPPEDGWRIINHATAAALEEVLQCAPARASALEALGAGFPNVHEYRQDL
jgi:predicted dienelactone hydrolase